MLVRSLDKSHLQNLIRAKTGKDSNATDLNSLYKEVYLLNLSTTNLVDFIRSEYPRVREARKKIEESLPELVRDFGEVRCGLRNDRVDDLVKELVRDKSIKTRGDLEEAIKTRVVSKIQDYALWSFFNQVTNDLIEHFFNDHRSVVPTLRKIPNVDFFMELNGKVTPFDLKITHISEDFFDMYSLGMKPVQDGTDSYVVTSKSEKCTSEREKLGSIYKKIKKELELPNMAQQSKAELLENLNKANISKETQTELNKLLVSRQMMTNNIVRDAGPLEYWNYKMQGERLFCNNNRFFVFLAYENSFEDARPLKGKLEAIATKVKRPLVIPCGS